MSLWSRLRETISSLFESEQRAERVERELPQSPGDVIRDWVTPAPPGEDTDRNVIRDSTVSSIDDLGAWESGLFADYVPEDLWADSRLLEAFDTGFGEGMGTHDTEDIKAARSDWFDILEEHGIFLDRDEYWAAWREEYEESK